MLVRYVILIPRSLSPPYEYIEGGDFRALLTVDGLETGGLPRDPYQFPVIKATDSSITLEAAPLSIVQKTLSEEFATGQLQVRVINSSSQ